MNLPNDMVERACQAYWAASGKFVSTEDRMRAALEAALSEADTGVVKRERSDAPFGTVAHFVLPESWIGRRVALVPLDD